MNWNPARFSAMRRRLCIVFVVSLSIAGTAWAGQNPVEARKPITPPKVGAKLALPAVFRKADPQTTADLISMQTHVAKLVEKITKATVGLRIGGAQGSGAIVTADGYVLTAGHVSGKAGRKVTIIFPDGKRAKGITLGANRRLDAGLVKITDKGPWPFLPIGTDKDLKVGDWCLATGHPGGFRPGRPPVVRLGRVIVKNSRFLQTDAILVGGDSGGPLFDMHGRVIAINSRIGRTTTQNIHVPISAYSLDWVPLVQSKVWRGALLGINGGGKGNTDPRGIKVAGVPKDFPADRAGLKVGDVITKFDGQPVKTFARLVQLVGRKSPGNKVTIEYIRGGKTITVTVTLARR